MKDKILLPILFLLLLVPFIPQAFSAPPSPKPSKPPAPTRSPKYSPSPTPTSKPTNTPTPTPAIITIAQNQVTTANGPTVTLPSGYKSMTITVSAPSGLVGWSPQVSFDGGSTWFEQHRFGCCSPVTIPIFSQTFRFSPGTGSGTVNVSGELRDEPNAQIIIFGSGVTYPFTSSDFLSIGKSSIIITAGSGNNPQNITGILLQKLENSSYITTSSLVCDGGATCPFQSLPVSDGIYRVVIEGNGTNALFGAILRP